MTLQEYMLKAEEIAAREFMSRADMLREINIAYNTWIRLKNATGKCSLMTTRKIKKFVDNWENK